MTEYYLNEKGSTNIEIPSSIEEGDIFILQYTNQDVNFSFPVDCTVLFRVYGAASDGYGGVVEGELNVLKEDCFTMKCNEMGVGGGRGGSGGRGVGGSSSLPVYAGGSGQSGGGSSYVLKNNKPLLIAGGGGGGGGRGGGSVGPRITYSGGSPGKGGDAGSLGASGSSGQKSHDQPISTGGAGGSILSGGGAGGYAAINIGSSSSRGSEGLNGPTIYDGGGGGGGAGGISINDRYIGGGGGGGGAGGENFIDEDSLISSSVLDELNSSDGKIEIFILSAPVQRTLILSDGEYKKIEDKEWQTVSPTLPTAEQFKEHGMEDLSVLDRKVQPVLDSPIQMTNEGQLGEGKLFKGTVDLKKYFDLRKLEIK